MEKELDIKKDELLEELQRTSLLFHRMHHHQIDYRSHGKARLLNVLLKEDGLQIRDLVERLDIRPSSAGELVAKAERNEYVRVEVDPSDKRAKKVFITEKGKAFIEQQATGRKSIFAEAFNKLTEEEQSQLYTLTKKLNDALLEIRSPEGHDERHKRHRRGCGRGRAIDGGRVIDGGHRRHIHTEEMTTD